MTDITTTTVRSRDGTALNLVHVPHAAPRATVLIVHGFAEHIRRYDHVVRFLHERGYEVAGLDVRGHGSSGGRRCFVERFDEYLDDVDAALNHVATRGARKLFLLAHSHGGLITARYLEQHPEGVDGAVLTSPLFGFKVEVPAWKRILGRSMSVLWPSLAIPSGIPPEHVSHDPEIIRAYAADPLNSKIATARWYTECVAAQALALADAHRLRLPMLVLQAGDDRIVDAARSENFLAAVGSRDKAFVSYPGLFHEILNEPEKATILPAIDAWLTARL